MTITTENYFSTLRKFNLKDLPEALFLSHDFIVQETNNGKDWSAFGKDAGFTRMAKLIFKKLEEFMNSEKKAKTMHGVEGIANVYQLEISLIKAFLALDGKISEAKEVHVLIENLKQKISRHSPFAKDINYVQAGLLKIYNGNKRNQIKITLKPETKARLLKAIKNAQGKKTILYKPLPVKTKDQDSLQGIEEETEEEEAAPEPKKEEGKIMSSVDFADMHFDTIGFQDKWLNFMGDPSPGFTAMVFGMPKMGKSYLCVDFANYLSLNHGKVLYVSKEEFMSPTLAIKLKDKNVSNDHLDIAGSLPDDLSSYDFIFLDSVTSLKLSPDDLKKLEEKYPDKSFVYVFQVTKNGKARGTNEYMHNVDVVIEIPEKGKAVQNGRFNQGGELDIFNEGESVEDVEDLNGIKKNPKSPDAPKKKTSKVSDWTEPKGSSASDWRNLKIIRKYYNAGEFKEAMNHAMDCDTEVREGIPGNIWLKMGGQLTPSGVEKLKASSKSNSSEHKKGFENPTTAAYYGDTPDANNPNFIFSMTATSLLVSILDGVINIDWLVRAELANRGLNKAGDWVGFTEAAKIHKIKT